MFRSVFQSYIYCNKFGPLLRKNVIIRTLCQQNSASSYDVRDGFAHKNTMYAWQSDKLHDLDGIQLSCIRIPPLLKPNEILIKVSASSVNPIDVAAIGGYGTEVFETMRTLDDLCNGSFDSNKSDFPLIVGRDFAGEIVRLGQDVSKFSIKDKVWGFISPHKQGCHAEYVVAEASNVRAMPQLVTSVKASSIPYAALTAWSAAVISGGMTPNNCYGSRALVIGASGGVGIILTQLLNLWGAEVVGVCSSESTDLVLSCGALEVYDYKDCQSKIDLTSSPSFDVIIDASGYPDVLWAEGLRKWKNASYVSLSSPLLRNADEFGIVAGFAKSLGEIVKHNVEFISDGRFIKWAFFMPNPCAFDEITTLVSKGKLRPVVQNVFRFENAVDAYKHVLNGPKRGKTVIDFSSDASDSVSEETRNVSEET